MIRAIYLRDAKGVLSKAQLAGFGMVFCACGRYLGQDVVVGLKCWARQEGVPCTRAVESIQRVGDPKYEGTFNVDGSFGGKPDGEASAAVAPAAEEPAGE